MNEEEAMAFQWRNVRKSFQHGAKHAAKFASLAIMGIIFSAACYGQSLVVQSGGNAVSQGQTLSINTIPNMPNLVLNVSGVSGCEGFSYQIDVTYTDQAGHATAATYGGDGYLAGTPVTIDWNGIQEGGAAIINWQLDGVSETTFFFNIVGTNPTPPSVVDAYVSGGPWFIRNMVAKESSYRQFDGSGNPLWGSPDGIGLLQLEPPARASLDQDYWTWPTNLVDGLSWLNGLQSGAYANWILEYNDMLTNTSSHGRQPVPAYFHAGICTFSSAYANGSPNGFGDGNWIHLYNGWYFVDWVDIGNPNFPNGGWEYDVQGPTNGYTTSVCTATPQ